MRHEEFVSLCQAVDAGAERYVEDIFRHETGRVLTCRGDGFEVEVSGNRENWSSENCTASTSTSAFRPPYSSEIE